MSKRRRLECSLMLQVRVGDISKYLGLALDTDGYKLKYFYMCVDI